MQSLLVRNKKKEHVGAIATKFEENSAETSNCLALYSVGNRQRVT